MNPHRDVFKVLHPTLQSWLDTFEQDCQRYGGATYLYNSLVMLGLERPNNPAAIPGSKFDALNLGCDCLAVIADETKDIARQEESIRFWQTREHPFLQDVILEKRDSIVRCRESIALYESMHASHADFNRRVHFLLRNVCQRGMLAKIRAVCLRDLRHAAKNNGQGKIATPSYGRELATFLTYDPQGWW
jgi:hypothetical protein